MADCRSMSSCDDFKKTNVDSQFKLNAQSVLYCILISILVLGGITLETSNHCQKRVKLLINRHYIRMLATAGGGGGGHNKIAKA